MFILNENPVPTRDRMPGLAKELATVIDKALVRNPKDRFPDAGKLLLPGREDAVLSVQTDQSLRERIEELAAKNTEGTLSSEEHEEYVGYVRANKFVAVLRREAKKFKSGSAA